MSSFSIFTSLLLLALLPSFLGAETIKPLYASPVLRSGDKVRAIDIELDLPEKTREFFLVVSDEGNHSHDWANWINPRVIVKGETVALTHGSWENASTGHGNLGNNKNSGGKPLTIDGKIYPQGIGAHAPSVIQFTLPWNSTKFLATIGLDDGGAIRGNKPTPSEVRFFIYDKPPPANAATPGKALDPPGLVATERFTTLPGLEVSVWATSPMLFNPTNMDTDAHGRIWVTEGVNYRRHADRRPDGDRIVVLEDSNGDGSADKSSTFVQDPDLEAPLGISVLDNRILVAQPPNIVIYTDHDRDLVFDESKGDTREEFLTGFNGRQHDHSLHAVMAGPDGNWYINQGNTGAKFTDNDGVTFRIGGPYGGGGGTYYHNNSQLGGQVSDDGKIWTGGFAARIKPDGTGTTIVGHGFRNSYETCLSSFGDMFQNDNDDPPASRNTWLMEGGFLGFFSRDGKRTWQADQRPGQTIPEAEWRQHDPGTLPPGDVYGPGSPTGICYYENGVLGPDHGGMLLSCEARQMVIFGYKPKPDGANFTMERFDFLRANNTDLFRPSDVMVGADGAIYVADWYDPGVGGHADRDEATAGTIYRIAPKDFTPAIAPLPEDKLAAASALLQSPAFHPRNTGFETLKALGTEALPAVREVAKSPDAHIAARATWLLPLLGDDGTADTQALLQHEDPTQRLLALRSLRNAGHDPLNLAEVLATDSSPAVRRELAISLRYHGKEKLDTVVNLLRAYDGEDRTYLEACGLAAEGSETEIWDALYNPAIAPVEWSKSFANITWRLQPVAATDALIERANAPALDQSARLLAVDTLAFTRDQKAADAMATIAATEGSPSAEYATAWLLRRAYNEWKDFGVVDILKERDIYNPDTATATAMPFPTWDEKTKLPPIPEIIALEGDAEKGKIAASRCIMCHQIDGQGVDYGPDLKGWVANQGADAFLNAVVWPNQGIAHGYDGVRIILQKKDGEKKPGEIHGIPINTSDPMMVRTMGGLTQMFPANLANGGAKPLKRTLMLSADQLGFTAQDLADLTEYMKGY